MGDINANPLPSVERATLATEPISHNEVQKGSQIESSALEPPLRAESVALPERRKVRKPRSKKRGCCGCFLLLFLLTLVFLCTVVASLLYSYRKWTADFESDVVAKSMVVVDVESFQYDDERESTQIKIDRFIDGSEQVDFVEFTDVEVAVLFADMLSRSLPEYLSLDKLYLDSAEGKWNLYIELRNGQVKLPIIHFVIVKDQLESVELFIEQINVGPFNLKLIGFEALRHNINKAYYDAVLSVNDNKFGTHTIENIELEEDSLIIKGRRN